MGLSNILQSILGIPKSYSNYGQAAAGPKPTQAPVQGAVYTPQASPSKPLIYNGPAFGPQYKPPASWYAKPAAKTAAPAPSAPTSSGATRSFDTGGGGNNGGGGSGPAPTLSYLNNNMGLGSNDVNPYADLEAAAQQGDAAARAQLETMYAQRDAELQNQLNYTTEQKTNTLSELDRQLQNYVSGVDKQKTQTNEDVNSAVSDAASTAQNVQRSNRNVLRGLGILNSSYAGDQLAQPTNEFDKQRATLQKWGMTQLANLDDQKRQKQGEFDSQRNTVISQFNDLVGKIQTDMRFNEREKIGALQSAQAALQQRMAEINQQKVNYATQVNQTKNALLSDLVKLQVAAPKADIGGILSKSMALIQGMQTPQPQSQQVSIYGSTVPDKRKLSAFGN